MKLKKFKFKKVKSTNNTAIRIIKENKFNLIEALAEKILNVIMLKYTVVESSVVRVRKPFAPIKGIFDNIEFEIVKKRNDHE